jgi:hypothetical protein
MLRLKHKPELTEGEVMEYMESRMQDQMEAGIAEHDDLCERLNPPEDWQQPNWELEDKVHNWRNYASKDLQHEWLNMSGKQRLIIAAALDDIASNEHWD